MKIRVADYIAAFLVDHGVQACFTVTGGGAMHLNDALGHQAALRCVYQHHEQACAMAAEAYARVHNRMAAVCVTSGPGGTNAMTGVLGAFLDSIPMLVLSGQVRYATTARSTGLPLRALGDQEFDITKSVAAMTKYAVMVEDPMQIRYELEKACHLAQTGRRGPCWLDIPLDVQGALVDTALLRGYEQAAPQAPPVCVESVQTVLKKLQSAKRPLLYAGSAIRQCGAHALFSQITERLGIPVVCAWNAVDVMPTDHPLYVGRGGPMGDRAGNFAVQNADVILALGTRLSIRQVGYHYESFAPNAFLMMVDVDLAELQKPTLHVSLPLHADLLEFLQVMEAQSRHIAPLCPDNGWRKACIAWRVRYPVVQERHKNATGAVNPYAFLQTLSRALPENAVTVVGNGSACVMGSQAYTVREKQRFLVNSGAASMGYDLPAAIGACVALSGGEVVCVTGDGSIQMNLQELQTILTNHLPIKIFLLNNGGYHSIRQTQANLFSDRTHVGIGPESGDLSFPSMEKLASAYGYPYFSCHTNARAEETVRQVLRERGAAIAEIFVDQTQPFEPKSATRRLADGTLYSPPLEDMSPPLSPEELEENMQISKTEQF